VKTVIALTALLVLCACSNDAEDSSFSQESVAQKPLTPAELEQSRAASRRSYEAFLKASETAIAAELSKCRSAILDELKQQHLNAMLSDKPNRTIADMKREAKDDLKRLAADPSSPGLDVVMESVNFCTFDRDLSDRRVQQGSGFCEFKDGKYSQHGIGATTEVPKGLVYTCDGYGL